MADGFDIHLDESRAKRLQEAAEAAGVRPETYALQLLDEALEELSQELAWDEDLRRAQEFDETGNAAPMDEVFDQLEADLRARLIGAG